MKIHFTKKEYRVLLDVVNIARWVLDSHRAEKRESDKRYDDLEQKIFSYAKDFGYDDLVTFDKGDNAYYPNRILEDDGPVNEIIEEYEASVFWDELEHRLARRDLVREVGFEAVQEMDAYERFRRIEEIAESYGQEFSQNDLNSIEIKGR